MPEEYINIEKLVNTPIEERECEFVERKGLGHPDYIADAIAEATSVRLSKIYLERYGRILHHNVDKVLVVGGQASPRFKGGEVLHPIYILVAGRATTEINTKNGIEQIPIGPIILNEAKNWLRNNFRFLNPEEHVIIDYKIGKGSADLVSTFERGIKMPLANDTSIGISYAPLSTTEKITYEIERYLNSSDFKSRLPPVGEDIKVMSFRKGKKIEITVAAAIISSLVSDVDEYINIKEEIKEKVSNLVCKMAPEIEFTVNVNTADDPSTGKEEALYLVVTGTSAEQGDDGMTGRGNRVNGLITPMRPMSMEATAGKNPVSHVGKIYNVLANIAANKIAGIDGVREVYVKLLSQIGKPINRPLSATISIVPDASVSFNSISYEAKSIMEDLLAKIPELTKLIVEGKVQLF